MNHIIVFFDLQTPLDYLQPLQETTFYSEDGFVLRYRSREIRFHIDKARFGGNSRNSMKLTCYSKLEGLPHYVRETSIVVAIRSTDSLRNQKLINWRNSGELNIIKYLFYIFTSYILLLIIFYISCLKFQLKIKQLILLCDVDIFQ